MSCWARTLTRARPAGRDTRGARADPRSSVAAGALAARCGRPPARTRGGRASSAACTFCSTRNTPTPRAVDLGQRLEDGGDQPGRDAERRLVEHEQARRAHQRAADGDHLLLAARQRADQLACGARAGRGRARRRARGSAACAARRARREGAQLEVLLHGHAAEQPAALGHQRQPALDDLVRVQRARGPGRPSGWRRRAGAGGRRWSSAACSCRRRWGRAARRSRRRRP